MIRRLYVHNFRCLENLDLRLPEEPSILLIGANGSGKTTVGMALEILQDVARGTNRVGDLVNLSQLAHGRTDSPLRIEIDVELRQVIHRYSVALEFPKGFKELRVLEESFIVDGRPVYTRELAQVSLPRNDSGRDSKFGIDWHLVALPIIDTQDEALATFRQWLSRMIILRPVPSLINGESNEDTLQPDVDVKNFGAWFSGLLAYAPSSYGKIDAYLRQVMPDFRDIKNPAVGKDARSLVVQFSTALGSLHLPFEDLSDGEKCFLICALVLAANEIYGPVFCFWDEPDNYLALSEVGHFLMALRKTFQNSGQIVVTSHNPEAIRRFSDENTLVLYRKSHMEPTIVRPLSEVPYGGDLVGALVRGDVGP